jgi:5'-nucleotidase (lipoprotein e(P4) family)
VFRTLACIAVFCSYLALSSPKAPAPDYENLNAVLWMETSVEYRASATQTYRAAQAALLDALKDHHWTAALEQNADFENLPPAVILDLDETVLDNFAYQARLVGSLDDKDGGYTPESWMKWVNERRAGLIPGAMDFLQFAHANGVAPLYITNRTCDPANNDDPTVTNLRALHLPTEPIAERLFCAQPEKGSDKTERRKLCASKYRILLIFGDQLGDFLQIPADAANLEGRDKLFAAHQSLWGERWFQLPNPTYGSWVNALGRTIEEKLPKLRK